MTSILLRKELDNFLIELFECSVIFILSIIFSEIVLSSYGLKIGGFK